MSITKINLTKLASAISKKFKKLRAEDKIHIDNDEWKRTKKKAEIVDLWHQVAKESHNSSRSYNNSFPFEEAEKTGIEFWCWGSALGIGKTVRKKLDNLKVKYNEDESE